MKKISLRLPHFFFHVTDFCYDLLRCYGSFSACNLYTKIYLMSLHFDDRRRGGQRKIWSCNYQAAVLYQCDTHSCEKGSVDFTLTYGGALTLLCNERSSWMLKYHCLVAGLQDTDQGLLNSAVSDKGSGWTIQSLCLHFSCYCFHSVCLLTIL